MNFITIGEYFNKLYSAVLLILLFPIVLFFLLYNFSSGEAMSASDSPEVVALLAFVAIDWIAVFVLFNKKIKSIPHGQGLRVKLERYFNLTIVRYTVGILGCLGLAVGFYLTQNDFFTGGFALSLILLGLLWPMPAKVSKDLRLRGDEREMVYYKKDAL